MSALFKQPTANMPVYFGSSIVDHLTAWEKGPWLIVHKEQLGVPYLWRYQLQLFPIVYGQGERRGKGNYAERFIEPFFAVKNGAVAAILFAHIIQEINKVDGFAVATRWQAIAHELDWDNNYDHEDERDKPCERCYVALDRAQHWLRSRDEAL